MKIYKAYAYLSAESGCLSLKDPGYSFKPELISCQWTIVNDERPTKHDQRS